MKYSIVIPTYNHCDDLLKPCLESIIQYTDLSKNDVEVIVVANGCKDNTKQYMMSLGCTSWDPSPEKYCPFKLIWSDEAWGYTKSTNEGIKAATGEYIVLLNNDTVLLNQEKGTWLRMMEQPFEDPKVGITGPMKAYCPYAKKEFMIFFCVMVKREMFDKIGLLDEIFNPGFGEDTDFCVKLQNLGYQIVQVPDTKHTYSKPNFMVGNMPIYHKGEGTFSGMTGGDKLLAERRFMLMNRYSKEIKLNLGCGDKLMPGYFNIDLENGAADLQWDIRKLPLDDNKVDEIVSIQVLEHFKPEEVSGILAEWFRVLKPTGRLILEVPDILEICKNFEAADKNKRYELLNCIYGVTFPQFPHRFGWYEEILGDHLRTAGFTSIIKKPAQVQHWGYNMRIECEKQPSALPTGWFSDQDINVYNSFVGRVPTEGTMVEVGTYVGRSICSVANVIKDHKLKVYTVDTYEGSSNDETKALMKSMDGFSQFKENIERFGLTNHISAIKETSQDAALRFADKSVDMVFIDAEHSYEALKKDIASWYPKIKPGGELCGHDYLWPEVSRCLKEEFGARVHTDLNNMWYVRVPKVYDGFMFFNEFDVLDIRLAELDPVVDKFVLVEARQTISKQPKPLYFEENKQRYAQYLNKIIHVIVEQMPEGDQWAAERYQREAILQGFKDLDDEDIVMISDVDEIPRASCVAQYNINMGLYGFVQNLYYYFLNCRSSSTWNWLRILPWGMAKQMSAGQIRYTNTMPAFEDAGWHFSFLGGIEKIQEKIRSYSHQEYNRPDILDPDHIKECLAKGVDIFKRPGLTHSFVELDETFPQYVKDNVARFTPLIQNFSVEVAS